MNTIKAFLAKYKLTAKTFVVAWGLVTATYATNGAFHAFVLDAYAHVPGFVKTAVVGLGPMVLALWNARKELESTL